MKKQVFQFFLTIAAVFLLTACQNREADSSIEVIDEGAPSPPLTSDASEVVIDEVFFSRASSDEPEGLSLYSFSAPESETADIQSTTAFASSGEIALSLNTSDVNGKKPDYSILVNHDSVYSIEHASNELRLLKHFQHRVCEVLPKKEVVSTITGVGLAKTETYTTKHAESVYVVTVDINDDISACYLANATKYYYELPLNYQFDSSDADDSTSNELSVVDEAVARAHLIFGWADNPELAGESILTHGYLGYSHALRRLQFFDSEREAVWSQSRELKTYANVELNGRFTPTYVFNVRPLGDYQYLVQFNQDVFVVDSSTELFSKSQSDVASILIDRVLKIGTYLPHNSTSQTAGIEEVENYFDDDDLVLIDNGKIFNYKYQQNRFLPDLPSHNYVVEGGVDSEISGELLPNKQTFSQFDYQQCPDNESACLAAHDITSGDWQFMVGCEDSLACDMDVSLDDYCETQEEQVISQSDEPLCSPEFYQHIGELNRVENDAEFRGFMQYLPDSINNYQATLHDNSLIISAAMLKKDIIVRYFYNQPLSAPKSVREHVMFGAETDLFGLEYFVENNNMFVNMLIPEAVRSNECYKDYVQVACQLGSELEGDSTICTGKDLQDGLCRSTFIEFESAALFCSPLELEQRACDDLSLESEDFRVEIEAEDAKWLRLSDYSGLESDFSSMFLLKSLHADATSSDQLDEGKLVMPELYSINDTDGEIDQLVGKLSGLVETVVGGTIYEWLDDSSQRMPLIEGQLDILADDIGLIEAGSTYSRQEKYVLANTLSDDSPVPVRLVRKVTDLLIERLDTLPKTIGDADK